jgi:hypothetical protein
VKAKNKIGTKSDHHRKGPNGPFRTSTDLKGNPVLDLIATFVIRAIILLWMAYFVLGGAAMIISAIISI